MLTDQQHPITPPEELVQEWCRNWTYAHGEFGVYLATQAARWGFRQCIKVDAASLEDKLQKARDQELEACCEWLREARNHGFGYDMGRILADNLRAARRPKPLSLAEQATAELDIAVIRGDCITTSDAIPSLRAALERLQELEECNE